VSRQRTTTYSIAIVSLVVAMAAAAAPATKLLQSGAYDAWLGSSPAPADEEAAAAATPKHALARLSSPPSTAVRPMDQNALAPAALPPAQATLDGTANSGSARVAAGASRSSSGWSSSSSFARRFASGSESTGSAASLGGMWHAMNPLSGHRAPAGESASARVQSSTATAVGTSSPSPRPAPKPAPPSSSAAPAPPAASVTPTFDSGDMPAPAPPESAAAPSPTAGFDEDETPIGGLDPGAAGSGGGTLGDGSTGGGSSSGGGVSPAATPEPATIAMFGTGLVGILGALRRRRRP
jgi:PEP-CTERM motif